MFGAVYHGPLVSATCLHMVCAAGSQCALMVWTWQSDLIIGTCFNTLQRVSSTWFNICTKVSICKHPRFHMSWDGALSNRDQMPGLTVAVLLNWMPLERSYLGFSSSVSLFHCVSSSKGWAAAPCGFLIATTLRSGVLLEVGRGWISHCFRVGCDSLSVSLAGVKGT